MAWHCSHQHHHHSSSKSWSKISMLLSSCTDSSNLQGNYTANMKIKLYNNVRVIHRTFSCVLNEPTKTKTSERLSQGNQWLITDWKVTDLCMCWVRPLVQQLHSATRQSKQYMVTSSSAWWSQKRTPRLNVRLRWVDRSTTLWRADFTWTPYNHIRAALVMTTVGFLSQGRWGLV